LSSALESIDPTRPIHAGLHAGISATRQMRAMTSRNL
jgi:hypothetical protein